jgi:hypothetical protein
MRRTGSVAEGGRRQQQGAVTSGLQMTVREAQAVLA